MRSLKLSLCGCCMFGVFGVVAMGAEVAMVPISASGTHTIVGNEITLDGGGQRVFLELELSGWGPDALKAWQVSLDSSSYSSGVQGTLAPVVVDCTADPGVCATELGSGSVCPFPPTVCPAGFIDQNRPDYVFSSVNNLPAVDISTLDYRYASTVLLAAPVPDPGIAQYAGTLVLDAPVGAIGTFTIAFLTGSEHTTLLNQNDQSIQPLIFTPALITITCQADGDCDDSDECTDDACEPDGTCSNTNNYDDSVDCCNPADGSLTPIDDGNQCTDDVCNEDGSVDHNPTPGDPCDDGVYCNGTDTCDGSSCSLHAGDPCPGPDGDGDCAESCNEQADDCTAADPEGSACDDGEYCNGAETCSVGVCGGSTGDPCTGPDGDGDCAESCDEIADDCTAPDPGGAACDLDGLFCTDDACDGSGTCAAGGDPCPGPDDDDDCAESCNEAAGDCTANDPVDSLCDDGDPCTGTGREGIGVDMCTAEGMCYGEPDPECNDQCAFAIEAFEGVTTGNNEGSGPDDVEASCQPDSNNDVWFVYTATCTGTTFVSTTGSEFAPANDPVLSIYDACPDQGGAEIACDDDSGADLQAALTFATVAETPYWIRVAGFEDSAGSIFLNIEPFDECLIDGVCYPEGAINPENDCEACIPEVATMAWSPRPEGATCGDPTDTDCDGYDACDGAGVCEPNYKVEGSACGDPSDTECDNPDTCDGVGTCLPNYELEGVSCGSPDDTQCDNPDICDGMGLCDDNFEVDGTPCDDENICTENDVCDTGQCVGTPIPQAPLVVSEGPRHLAVTPQPVSSVAPVALLVTSPDWTCISKYIQADGSLGTDPVFQLPDEWDTAVVQSPDLVPSSTYNVVAECGTYTSAAGSATTAIFGDIVGEGTAGEWGPPDGRVDVLDLTAIADAFRHLPSAPGDERADLWPCTPDGVIDVLDMTMVADAFQGYSYWESTGCPVPCP